jgi:phosphoserine phosphatase
MTHVATLVSNPALRALDETIVQRATKSLPGAGRINWLAEGVAADICFTPGPQEEARAFADMLRSAMDEAPVDIIVQPVARRRKKLLIADMDSTMIGQECIDELADFVGMKAHVAAITERAMRGEIAFEPALRERAALLKGLEAAIVNKVLDERISLTPGARALVQTMRAHGAYTALISGGFTLFTRAIAQKIGFHGNQANELLIENDLFTGLVREPILGREAKLAALLRLREEHRLAAADTLAVGDGANDLAMLQEAGLGVAYRAKPAVAAAAHARIDHCDLTALLYAQGYKSADIVGD